MNFSCEENGFLLSAESHSYLLRLPVLSVSEGLLDSANCRSIDERRDENCLSVSVRWQAEDRVYLGEAVLKSCGPGVRWQLTVTPEDGGGWKLFHSEEGSGELRGWAAAGDVMLFHGDNVRGVTQDCSLLEGSYLIPVSQWKRPVNGGRWQSFPGLWAMEPGVGEGIRLRRTFTRNLEIHPSWPRLLGFERPTARKNGCAGH